jgi:erythronate-4-phosphate dehydrogenase
MRIVADENIPFAIEAFGRLGEVTTLPGRAMTHEAVRDAEILFVRSVTDVDAHLLDGSKVRFVATATIGTDHVDAAYLRARGTGFASAPGSNARSVAEYISAALLVLESRGHVSLDGSTLGVVGVGSVGSRVALVAQALGMKVLLNDPPRARAEPGGAFVPLDEICAKADVVTFHLSLERGGPDATHHLAGEALLGRLKPGAVVLNSSRGAVADGAALKRARRDGHLKALVLDVWEGEPSIDAELLGLCDLATPHIAGYSYDGKVAGTRMIYEAACAFLGRPAAWPAGLPPHEDLRVRVDDGRALTAVRASYDIEADDGRMRRAVEGADAAGVARAFDRLRKEYPRRREFANWRVAGATGRSASVLAALGFRME